MSALNSITLLGQSGVGKTTLSTILQSGGWYHYSGDYRIATHYLADDLAQWLQSEAEKLPIFAELMAKNALAIKGCVEIENLALLSQYIGKVGRQGIDLELFKHRQARFVEAEKKAMYDVTRFKARSQRDTDCQGFINDAGGSLIEYVDDVALFDYLRKETIFVYIDADEQLQVELMQRAIQYPKPICYHFQFLEKMIKAYQIQVGESDPNAFESDDFLKFVTPKLLMHRRENALSFISRYGVRLEAKEVWRVKTANEFQELLSYEWQKQRG